jgi:ParB-like chromosome segregation protein Spo0J
MSQKIEWSTTKVKICDLKDYEHNPRKISKKDFERLVNDIRRDGYHNRILVDNDLTIIGGHSRSKALISAGYSGNQEIEVLKCSRSLSEEEFKRINVKDNLPYGEFDFDILANQFDVSALLEWGMPEQWFAMTELETTLDNEPDPSIEKCESCGRQL